VLLQSRDFAAAALQLQPLIATFERTGQDARAAQARLQDALARAALGHAAAARAQALAALGIGHRLGLLRSLLEVSPEVVALLEDAVGDGSIDPVLRFHVRRMKLVASWSVNASSPDATLPAPQEILSQREYDVLTLLAQAMPNKKIAKVLDVSPDTVKFHLKNIYIKLGVTARDEAVARLRDGQG
jgi:LuxR family maltose regulon positive regulatory protein